MRIFTPFSRFFLSGSAGCKRVPTPLPVLLLTIALLVTACGQPSGDFPAPDPDNGGLILPDGFEAFVVADSLGPARHLAVNDNGDIYVKLRRSYDDGMIVALRDTTGDGRADIIQRFGLHESRGSFHTTAKIRDGWLYVSTNLHVFRYPLIPGELLPDTTRRETLLIDDHERRYHAHQTKPITFDDQGNMYIPYGAPSDACQNPDRTPGLAGQDPCPELEKHGGIWVFTNEHFNQVQQESRAPTDTTHAVGRVYATGLRSIVAQDWHPIDRQLYAIQHGRDYLFRQWPEYYSRWDSAMLPAEEFVRVTEGSDFGWPFCYYNQMTETKVLAPEYGGDSQTVGRCSEFDDPVIGFPGHFAPNDLMFYEGDQFPDHYSYGAFIAWHGSTIRDPYPQAGYHVGFVPWLMDEGHFSTDWEVFANGFAVVDPLESTGQAHHRPMGLATGPDGSLYISDSVRGKIWRVMFTGNRDRFGEANLARMVEEKETASNIRTPHPEEDNLERGVELPGEVLYNTYCSACHGRDGQGAPPRFPPVAETRWVTEDRERLITIMLQGLDGPITVRGELYNNPMPAHDFMSDQEIAQVLTYVRSNFGNDADAIGEEEVRRMRELLDR